MEKELEKNEDILGENSESEPENSEIDFPQKRELLKNTKIVKQIWSIQEIFQKSKSGNLILDPDYQRNVVWNDAKKVSFIESLYMGILVPPIYVVEIPGKNVLDENRYEVVDGKQRIHSIISFLKDSLKFNKKYLEYFGDLFSGKTFSAICKDNNCTEYNQEMLSSVLDIYVITANSPEFTKYDIFSRLNRGAEPLRIDEIRKAIYHSPVLEKIEDYVMDKKDMLPYKDIFSKNDMKHYKDYGRFYRSIAFYMNTNLENNCVDNYNSRPREMINDILSKIQLQSIKIPDEILYEILDETLVLKEKLYKQEKADFIIDSLIPFVVKKLFDLKKIDQLLTDIELFNTLISSPGTTSNVNERIRVIKKYV